LSVFFYSLLPVRSIFKKIWGAIMCHRTYIRKHEVSEFYGILASWVEGRFGINVRKSKEEKRVIFLDTFLYICRRDLLKEELPWDRIPLNFSLVLTFVILKIILLV
jgi:hypothetical protein